MIFHLPQFNGSVVEDVRFHLVFYCNVFYRVFLYICCILFIRYLNNFIYQISLKYNIMQQSNKNDMPLGRDGSESTCYEK